MSLELLVENGNYKFKGTSHNITKEKNTLLKPFHKQVYNFGCKLCLQPTKNQEEQLNQQIGNARFVRNNYLSSRIEYYENTKNILSVSEYKKNYLPKLKEENEFLQLSDKFALESAIEHIDNAYKKFYENVKLYRKVGKYKKGRKHNNVYGFPQFASKYKPNGNKYTTKFTNNNIELLYIENLPYIKIPKVGKIRIILPKGKVIEDIVNNYTRITSISIQKEGSSYNVSLQLESIIDEIVPISSNHNLISRDSILSMDMGIKSFGILGNENYTKEIENPRWIKLHQKRLRRLQKSLSRKQYDVSTHQGSKNYYKAKDKVAKEQRKVKNQRLDFQHKLSKEIVNKCNVFICENLNIKGLLSNHKLSKEISSCGWSLFLNLVKYKLERKGGIFLQVDRFFASSKICYHCGHKNINLKLKDRVWECPQCKTKLDRDENAKNNLFKEGIRLLESNYNLQVI